MYIYNYREGLKQKNNKIMLLSTAAHVHCTYIHIYIIYITREGLKQKNYKIMLLSTAAHVYI